MYVYLNIETLCQNHPPTRHVEYKMIDLAPINISIMANKLPSRNLVRVLIQIKSPLPH